jgi:hypothetical protein
MIGNILTCYFFYITVASLDAPFCWEHQNQSEEPYGFNDRGLDDIDTVLCITLKVVLPLPLHHLFSVDRSGEDTATL